MGFVIHEEAPRSGALPAKSGRDARGPLDHDFSPTGTRPTTGQGRVLSHVDRGAYYACRDRYHLVIHSPGGSEMKAGGESAVFQPGELWCFNDKAVHEAFNHSNDWRIHLIFDLQPRGRPLHFQPPRPAAWRCGRAR